jgi:hypothetical protein
MITPDSGSGWVFNACVFYYKVCRERTGVWRLVLNLPKRASCTTRSSRLPAVTIIVLLPSFSKISDRQNLIATGN